MEHNFRVAAEALHVLQHIRCRGEALRRVFLHGVHRNLFEALRNGRVNARGRCGLCLHLHDGDGDRVIRNERQLTREHFIQHDTHGINIGLIVNITAARLLRRDIVHRADGLVGHGLRFCLREACDTEIRHLNGAVFQQHDVLRLDVSVNDALFVGVLQSAEDLHRKVQRLSPFDLALLLNVLLQGDAVNVLHDDILDAVAEADVIDLDDIRVRKHRNGFRFIAETAQEIAVARKLFLQNFNGDPALFNVVIRLIHVCHAAYAEKLVDLVSAVQTLAYIFIHSFSSFLSGSRSPRRSHYRCRPCCLHSGSAHRRVLLPDSC